MKYLYNFKLYERTVFDVQQELDDFQEEMDIEASIDKLIKSINGIELNITSMFPFLNGDEDINELHENARFLDNLDKKELKTSEVYNTDDYASLTKYPLRWIWIYEDEANDLEMPVYMIFQYYQRDDWSELKMYYVQDNIDNFLEELTEITAEIVKKENEDEKWIYTSSNSGEDWQLQNTDDATARFLPVLDWDAIERIAEDEKYKVIFK